MKQGCPFYISFTKLDDNVMKYRCTGINNIHTYVRDPYTIYRYSRYRNQNPDVHRQAVTLMNSGIRAGQAAAFLHNEYDSNIHPTDIHCLHQTTREKSRPNTGEELLSVSEMQQLADEISKKGDQYRIKYIGDTQMVHCFFYWNPAHVSLACSFCQVTRDSMNELIAGHTGRHHI